MADEARRAIDAVWRSEAAKIIGGLARIVRDVGLAEDLAQDALVAAMEHWPKEGLPDNPGAWLMATAKNKALDRLRQEALHARKQGELGADADARGDHVTPDIVAALEQAQSDRIDDDVLRLVFAACHPALSKEAQVALTLKLVAGLTTAEIARAYVVPEPTIAQRIVRAKRTLTAAHVPFEIPSEESLGVRVAAVLEVIYLIFNEGYTATAGRDWMRTALADEARRLVQMLEAIMPDQSEVHGLAALLDLQASRAAARVDANGEPILLLEQDRSRWDQSLIQRGLASLARARAASVTPGPYVLQASIAACHARARTPEATDWVQIVREYEALARRTPSPIVELNRAVAVGMASGPAAALPLVEAIAGDAAMARYHLLHAVRGDLLDKLGRHADARQAFKRAASLTQNERERALMLSRAQNVEKGGDQSS